MKTSPTKSVSNPASSGVVFRYAPLLVVAVIAVVMIIAALRAQQGVQGTLEEGITISEFRAPVQLIAGLSEQQSAQLPPAMAMAPLNTEAFDGKPWALHIWASWCVACRAEGGALARLGELLPGRVAGLAYLDNGRDIVRFAREYGLHYDALGIDRLGDAGFQWGVQAVPETLIVDGEGVVRWRYRGMLTPELVSIMADVISSINEVE